MSEKVAPDRASRRSLGPETRMSWPRVGALSPTASAGFLLLSLDSHVPVPRFSPPVKWGNHDTHYVAWFCWEVKEADA